MHDLLLRAVVVAQSAPGVHPDPNAPGMGVVQALINAAAMLALGVFVLCIIVGSVVWAAARSGNNPKAQSGAGRVVATGFIGALVIGAAKFAVDTGFDFGQLVK
jgi:hypothetical protein